MIEELKLKIKTYNALKRVGINTIEELKSVKMLRSIYRVGPCTEKEIKRKLRDYENKRL